MDDLCPRVPNGDQAALARASIGSACSIKNGHNPAAQIFFAVPTASASIRVCSLSPIFETDETAELARARIFGDWAT